MEFSENHLENDLRLMCDCQKLAVRKIAGPLAKYSGKPYYVCNQENRCKFFEFEEKSIERLRNLGVINDSHPSPLLFNMDQPNTTTRSSVKRKANSDDDDEISFWTSAPKNRDAGRSLFESNDKYRSTYTSSSTIHFQQTSSIPNNDRGMKHDHKSMELSRTITEHMCRQDRLLLASNKRIKFLLDEWNNSKDEIKRQKHEINYLKNRIQEVENDRSSISQTHANELYKIKVDLVASNTYNTQLLKEIETSKNSKDLEISRLSQMIKSYEKQIEDDNSQINNLVIQTNYLVDSNRNLAQKCSITNYQETQEFKRLNDEILCLKNNIMELEKNNDLLRKNGAYRHIENLEIDPATSNNESSNNNVRSGVDNNIKIKYEPIDLKLEPLEDQRM
ncbi:28810_t:CDS:1 [Dentiscutata erythropus]|uniref:28810_t:CDS:1 n=1 Tax=Dentiscutata erythropus TaxID=1348616 RepID=A0A9N9JRK6_9GLOM|nr:28810_t:CDS:1 [Dentiscutata erythropus]